ncbi:RNA polymerase sigma factor [Polyangium jinanense]|uniref:Sigma-70 family RNA polymerase sigma factor n=1 Tax=Polyangium jinanense TaxID=2829994 RepID=A0A9X4AR66_9BACT|nr:sigma-70 family RNA polymerase sigma factor [Polyangium jinanense]MDC3955487.1 sigma-70 family RNA polymerase sigma factor [Polyangium jinanense]MDC3981788.1 sigma-70 family RNA polymerase sigma factor [Polyangium jinanense]
MLAAVDTTPTREEFRTFYEENFPTVWRTLHRLRVREADVADIAHDVLVFAYNHFDEIPAYPQGWLARVCYEMVRNYRRKAARRLERLAPQVIDAAVDQHASDETMTEVVLEALERMPTDQRMLLLRYYVREEPLHALAKSLGIARSTVQLRLAAAETAFEGWIKTLLGVDPEKSSRESLFASFSLAGLLPRVWESSEVLAKAQLDGWERLSRAIDAAKIAAGAPRREAPQAIEPGIGAAGFPFKLTTAFAVALPSALAGMLLGHLGAGVASAHTTAAPSLHAATTPIAVVADALVRNTPQGDSGAPRAAPPSQEPAPARPGDPEVPMLWTIRRALKDENPKAALELLQEHARRFPKSTHLDECAELKSIAEKKLARMLAQEAAKKQASTEDKPKP